MENIISVNHLKLSFETSYENFTERLESAAGKFDESVLDEVAADPEGSKAKFKNMEGMENLMIFSSLDHGVLMNFYARSAKIKQYSIGNPVTASTMTRIDSGAALYAPLKLVVYESQDGTLRVEYDQPSSYFSQFGEEIARVGFALDAKLANLINFAAATDN